LKVSDITTYQVYFDVTFADASLTKLLVQSYEFLGMDGDDYEFQPLDPFGGPGAPTPSDSIYEGTIALTLKQVERLSDLNGLIERLLRIKEEGSE
jgi:hypothetical protein